VSIETVLLDTIQHWYVATGYFGLVLAMALESCCIPLPSEIVMPLAGYFVYKGLTTSTGQFSLIGVTIAGTLGCVIGSAIAYWIGASGGRELLLRYGKYILISKRDSDRADRWFAKYGSPVAFFSRLLPVVRTYISLPAGIARMSFGRFLLYTFLGSLPWTLALASLGVAFGSTFDTMLTKASTVFHGLDVVIVVLVVAAIAYYIYRHIKHNAEAEAEEAQVYPELRPTRYGPPTDGNRNVSAANSTGASARNGQSAQRYASARDVSGNGKRPATGSQRAGQPSRQSVASSFDDPTQPRANRPRQPSR